MEFENSHLKIRENHDNLHIIIENDGYNNQNEIVLYRDLQKSGLYQLYQDYTNIVKEEKNV